MMWYGAGEWWMGLSMLLFWGGVVALIVWAVRSPRASEPPRRRAIDILEERFARGEIDTDEFERRRAELQSGR